MQTRLSAQKRLLFLGFLIIGTTLGIMFISPNINGDKFVGGSAGCLISILLSHFIFPEIRESSRGIWNGNNILGVNMRTYFTHPTQMPLMLGLLWFVAVALILSLLVAFELKITVNEKTGIILWLFPCLLLFGLSGFLMLRRNEYVNQFGKLTTGFWARFNGVLAILCGWGGCVVLLVVIIFDL
jgi:hypothetical protein